MKRATERRARNPFFGSVERNGIRFVTATNARPVGDRAVSNPYYRRIEQDGGVRLRVRPGRPRKGEPAGATTVKSVRLPPQIWERVEVQAEREGMTRHAAIRQAILIWLQS
ncbi:MAG: CopG family transcriptional regulator [Deltaproteobacteria bacterium]|nr:CopG family transcriptional regulator [Deltaproteobacteria bacterium]